MEQCVPNRNPLEVNASVCMCFEEVTREMLRLFRHLEYLPRTQAHQHLQEDTALPLSEYLTSLHSPSKGNENQCGGNPNNYTSFFVTEPPATVTETEQAFGLLLLKHLKDKGGQSQTQTRENVIFLRRRLVCHEKTRQNAFLHCLNEIPCYRCSV
ncbi:hypothetical protein COOONC_16492 [Cooperia oncophora]